MLKLSVVFLSVLLFGLNSQAFHVFDNDDRTVVSESQKGLPWSAIGLLKNSLGSCTGTLIARDMVLTAAHCVYKDGDKYTGAMTFTPNYPHNTETTSVLSTWVGTSFPGEDKSLDFAILKLRAPIGDQYGWLNIEMRTPDELLKPDNYILSGYSGDLREENNVQVQSWTDVCSFTKDKVDSEMILHNCDTTGGASGASIFYYKDANKPETATIVAVHKSGRRAGLEAHLAKQKHLVGIPYTEATSNTAVPSSNFLPHLHKGISALNRERP